MTSQPEVPGASAVFLLREEIKDDALHETTIYRRLKILNEKGKGLADVEIPNYDPSVATIAGIEARTIHADGTIIPFKGKMVPKQNPGNNARTSFNVITMPDVQVGSIIEYRYKVISATTLLLLPEWYLQNNFWARTIHFVWRPLLDARRTSQYGRQSNGILWHSALPPGVSLKQSTLQTSAGSQPSYELIAHDIMPLPKETNMPPLTSYVLHVFFFYSYYASEDEFWADRGKDWSRTSDKFMVPGPEITSAVHGLTSASDTEDQKLRKIYDAVMQLENTSFTRLQDTTQEKDHELKEIHSADDVLLHKHGNKNELTELFVAMARAAGMKASLVAGVDRSRQIFLKNFLSFAQLGDYIAIVQVDNKEIFFDPGARYTPYGHLSWQHTMTDALRQTNSGVEFITTPHEMPSWSRLQRVANLAMDDSGFASGTVKMTYLGSEAVTTRQRFLTQSESVETENLRTGMEHLLPTGMEVKVASILNLTSYEQPLVIFYNVKGKIGSATGKHLILPPDIFDTNRKPRFPEEKRETTVYLSYPYMLQDALRITFPKSLTVESTPSATKENFQNFALYDTETIADSASFTTRRNFLLQEILFKTTQYPELRAFYTKMDSRDHDDIVFTKASATAGGGD